MRFVESTGVEAPSTLERLIEEARAGGPWPLLLGGENGKEAVETSSQVNREHYGSANQILLDANALSVADYFEQQRQERQEFIEEVLNDEWPSEPLARVDLTTHLKLSNNRPLAKVYFALLDVERPADSFAAIMWGGWNDCPDATVQTAIHRRWEDQWGAEVVSVTQDIVQCKVSRPPKTREDALCLAQEQYLYCPDIVEQGCDSIPRLASTLIDADYWYFWWD